MTNGAAVTWEGKRVLVVGLGASGRSVALLLREKGAGVIAIDSTASDEVRENARELTRQGIETEIGGQEREALEGIQMLVTSPGVPAEAAPLTLAREIGIPVISEIEVAWGLAPAPLVAVTGTNGKSTTVELIGKLLAKPGRRAFVCGNIGIPLSDMVKNAGAHDVLVVEVSSFQLETIIDFRPRIAVILNMEGDHLDRYQGDIDRYRKAKARVLMNQTREDFAVLNQDDPLVRDLSASTRAQVIPFSAREILSEGVFIREEEIVSCSAGKETPLAAVAGIKLRGVHNRQNVLAALAVASIYQVARSQAEAVLTGFGGLPHCLEAVGELRGISFVNDSKSTNPAAMRSALEALPGPFVLIAGGRDKGNDFRPLAELISQKVRVVMLLGEASQKIRDAWQGSARFVGVANMEEAVAQAYREAREGEIVLLSPGCASFDLYRNFRERGESFRRAVEKLQDA